MASGGRRCKGGKKGGKKGDKNVPIPVDSGVSVQEHRHMVLSSMKETVIRAKKIVCNHYQVSINTISLGEHHSHISGSLERIALKFENMADILENTTQQAKEMSPPIGVLSHFMSIVEEEAIKTAMASKTLNEKLLSIVNLAKGLCYCLLKQIKIGVI